MLTDYRITCKDLFGLVTITPSYKYIFQLVSIYVLTLLFQNEVNVGMSEIKELDLPLPSQTDNGRDRATKDAVTVMKSDELKHMCCK